LRWLEFVEQHGVVLASARGPIPSLAAEVAGELIVGSWWSHPKAQVIFETLSAIDDDVDVRCFKLVDGKVTFVHRQLWPALLGAAAGQARKSAGDLSDTARELRSLVSRRGALRLDRPSAAKLADDVELRQAAKELGERLLVVADQVDTESGKNTMRLRSWTRWRDGVEDPPERLVPNEGRAALEEAATALGRGSGHRPRLPWS
jgi:hypothetical protein